MPSFWALICENLWGIEATAFEIRKSQLELSNFFAISLWIWLQLCKFLLLWIDHMNTIILSPNPLESMINWGQSVQNTEKSIPSHSNTTLNKNNEISHLADPQTKIQLSTFKLVLIAPGDGVIVINSCGNFSSSFSLVWVIGTGEMPWNAERYTAESWIGHLDVSDGVRWAMD